MYNALPHYEKWIDPVLASTANQLNRRPCDGARLVADVSVNLKPFSYPDDPIFLCSLTDKGGGLTRVLARHQVLGQINHVADPRQDKQ